MEFSIFAARALEFTDIYFSFMSPMTFYRLNDPIFVVRLQY